MAEPPVELRGIRGRGVHQGGMSCGEYSRGGTRENTAGEGRAGREYPRGGTGGRVSVFFSFLLKGAQ